MTSIVGVHGVWNYRGDIVPSTAADQIAAIWQAALQRGPLPPDVPLDVQIAYYAPVIREIGRPSVPNSLDDLSGPALASVATWLALWDLPDQVRGGLPGIGSIRHGIGWIATQFGYSAPAIERFVAIFFDEADRYLTSPAQRRQARSIVAETIERAAYPRVVIAHSLGSVVAYEALWDRPDIGVDHWITVGSPLALPYVVHPRLETRAANGVPGRPPGVRRWSNLADHGDLVAIPRRAIPKMFTGVDQDDETREHWADFHLATNYLRTPEVADLLRPHFAVG